MSFTHVNKNISGEYCVIICRVVLQHAFAAPRRVILALHPCVFAYQIFQVGFSELAFSFKFMFHVCFLTPPPYFTGNYLTYFCYR